MVNIVVNKFWILQIWKNQFWLFVCLANIIFICHSQRSLVCNVGFITGEVSLGLNTSFRFACVKLIRGINFNWHYV